MFAYIKKGKVINIHVGDDKPEIEGLEILPVVEPTLDYDEDSQYAERNHRSEWKIKDNEVEITYTIVDKDMEESVAAMKHELVGTREHYIHSSIIVSIAGEPKPVMTSEKALSRLDQAVLDSKQRPDNWSKRWKFADGTRRTVDAVDIEFMRESVADHIDLCFQQEESLEQAIMDAVSFAELNAIDLNSGWPSVVSGE